MGGRSDRRQGFVFQYQSEAEGATVTSISARNRAPHPSPLYIYTSADVWAWAPGALPAHPFRLGRARPAGPRRSLVDLVDPRASGQRLEEHARDTRPVELVVAASLACAGALRAVPGTACPRTPPRNALARLQKPRQYFPSSTLQALLSCCCHPWCAPALVFAVVVCVI